MKAIKKISREDLRNRLASGRLGCDDVTDHPDDRPFTILEVLRYHYTGLDLLTRRAVNPSIQVDWPNTGDQPLGFVVAVKARSNLEDLRAAVDEAREYAEHGGKGPLHPMVLVPYLPEPHLVELQREGVSGIDDCGNGIVMVPGRLFVMRGGQPNRHREQRPLVNPFQGRSAMVGRMLLLVRRSDSVNSLHQAIGKQGADLSLSQVSKALAVLKERCLATKSDAGINLQNPQQLLDKLAVNWQWTPAHSEHPYDLEQDVDLIQELEQYRKSGSGMRWAVTGESSVGRHASFSQHGPIKIAVSNFEEFRHRMQGKLKKPMVKNFARYIFVDTREDGYFFHNEIDEAGWRWADPLQTWLELQAGDARQQAVAADIRKGLIQSQS